MDGFDKIAPFLGNPLVLVGFVLFLLFGIHKLLIGSGIIPPVESTAAPDIVKAILRYGFVVAVIVIVMGFMYAGVQSYVKAVFLTGNLSVVSADIDDRRDNKFPLLDVSFRNDGKSVAAIKYMYFTILNVWLAKSPYSPAARLVTGEYSTILPLSGEGCVIKLKQNQDVFSNSTDRVSVVLGNDAHPTYDKYIMNVKLEIEYNEDSEKIDAGSYIFITSPLQKPLAANVDYERQIEAAIYNQFVARAVSAMSTSHISAGAREWLDDNLGLIDYEISFIGTDSNPKENRMRAIDFLGKMGPISKPYLNKIQSIKSNDYDILESIAETVKKIEKIQTSIPNLKFVRDDGHTGCEEAPRELLMRYSAPF